MTNIILLLHKGSIMKKVGNYIQRIGSALSQLGNVIFLDGWPDESISGHCYRKNLSGQKFVNWLMGSPDHCRVSHEADITYSLMILDNYSLEEISALRDQYRKK